MNDDIDLYGDLIDSNNNNNSLIDEESDDNDQNKRLVILEEKLKQLERENELLKNESIEKTKQLDINKQQIQQINLQKDNLQKINEILMKNISSLFKTALAESQRKDKEIESLREQLNTRKLHHQQQRSKQ